MESERKKLLYIGHSYHNLTRSSLFLKEILGSIYEVEFLDFDPYSEGVGISFEHLKYRKFDVLVLFQVTPDIKQLKKIVQFKHAVFFPMFDGVVGVPDEFWETYRSFNIINFSKTLHERLVRLGLSSYYIQYFPKPFDSFDYGDPAHAYFWQRVSELNIDVVEKLLGETTIDKIHVHRALDPSQKDTAPSQNLAAKIEYSDWYETRGEMLNDIEACAIYIAPRPYEGIGMSFLEAMAMGRCVIAPNHATMNEYIVHGYTGLLYDYHQPKAIKISGIDRIQKNAIEYIRRGYNEWETDKYRILDWLEAPLLSNKQLERSRRCASEHIHFLFAFIPLLVKKDNLNKQYYDLFGFIRLLKIEKKGIRVAFYLFGFIPIWKIK